VDDNRIHGNDYVERHELFKSLGSGRKLLLALSENCNMIRFIGHT